MSIDVKESKISKIALEQVEEREDSDESANNNKSNWDWEELFHSASVYVFIIILMVVGLAIITLFNTGTDKFLLNLLKRNDTLNLMFSLILSAALEQLWNNKRELKYKITLLLELLLTIVGFIWYIVRSIAEIIILNKAEGALYAFESFFLNDQNMFMLNVFYIIFGFVVIICGFVVKANQNID